MVKRYPKIYLLLSVLILMGAAGVSFVDVHFFSILDNLALDIESTLASNSVVTKANDFALVLFDPPESESPLVHSINNLDLAKLIGILKTRKVKEILISFPVGRNHRENKEIIQKLRTRLVRELVMGKKKVSSSDLDRYFHDLETESDFDTLLLTKVKEAGNVLLTVPVSGKPSPCPTPNWMSKDLISVDQKFMPYFHLKDAYIGPVQFSELYEVSAGFGHCMILAPGSLPDRMHPPFILCSHGLLPSLPILLAIKNLGATRSQLEIAPDQMKIGNRVVPLYKGKLILSPASLNIDLPSYSASEILAKKRAPLELHNKSVIIGVQIPLLQGDKLVTGAFDKPLSRARFVAAIADIIIHGPYIKRSGISRGVELSLLVFVGLLSVFFFPRSRHLSSALFFSLLVLLSLFVGWVCISFFGLWIKTSYAVTASFAIFIISASVQIAQLDRVAKEAVEANRILGLNFQKQGVMDLAFERFRLCPLNNVTRDLIYELAQQCESRGLNSLAWQAYNYILKKGDFRDAAQRLAHLESLEKFPGFNPQGAKKREGPLSESFIKKQKAVGRYRIIKPLGKGTMGYVYKAVDPKINRTIALKIIRFSDEFDEDLISEIKERFFREAEIAGRLNHPSIVTVYDVGEDQDLTFMAMEYLEGHDLERHCRKEHLLPLMKVLEVVYQVADALEYAHKLDVIHRDIKPANIMLLKNGMVKVMDFGIAKAVSSSRTKTGVILGTPNYMSPEQIMGHKIDPRSDIFSLGVLFFQLLTAQLPFHGDNLSTLLYQITQAKHPSVRKLRPRVPKACEQIIDKALAKSRDDRFKSARDMQRYIHLLIMRLKEIKIKNKPD